MTSETRWMVEPFCKMGIRRVSESFGGGAVTSDSDKLSLPS